MATLTSMTAAPTQNTAPVHEFRCLYTRDLHKKSKKWHDGSTRFHTFNRRVMVYDDARNFIGDLHYRQEEDFGEGIEIRLDRGVLVEVGEPLGQTQTDLAPILERQRQEKGPSPRRPRPTPGLSQKPKSLLEVLGPSQSRVGYGRVPYQSPYEQRHSSSRLEVAEPASKRQRVASGKENHSEQTPLVSKPARPSLHQPVRPAPKATSYRETTTELEEVINLSSDEEIIAPPPKPVLPARAPKGERRHNQQQQSPSFTDLPTSRTALVPQQNPTEISGQSSKNKTSSRKSQVASVQPLTGAVEPQILFKPQPTSAPKARLLLAQIRPKPRLTCVLPRPPRPIHDLARQRLAPRPHRVQSPETEEEFIEEQDRICDPAPCADRDDGERSRDSSPLFLPEGDGLPQSSFSQPRPTQDEFTFDDLEDENVTNSLEQILAPQSWASIEEIQKTPIAQQICEKDVVEAAKSTEAKEMEAQPEMDDPGRSMSDTSPQPTSPIRNSELVDLLERASKEGDMGAASVADEAERDELETGNVAQQRDGQRLEPIEPESVSRPQPGPAKDRADAVACGETEISFSENHRPDSMLPQPAGGPHGGHQENEAMPQPAEGTDQTGERIVGQARAAAKPITALQQSASSHARAFRRVLSENDAEDDDVLSPIQAVEPRPRIPLAALNNVSTRRTPIKLTSPSKIHRSVSDTTALEWHDRRAALPREEVSKGPTGPWTTEEAFLLFDWWPADLEKPVYWTSVAIQPRVPMIQEAVPNNWGGITTARQVLRDDVNVL
jgi:hypothetical protein